MLVRAYIESNDYEQVSLILKEKGLNQFLNENKETYMQALKNSESFVCIENDVILGYIRALSDFRVSTFICELLVKDDFKNQGVERLLLDKVEKLALYGSTELISNKNDFYKDENYVVIGSGMRKSSTK